MDDDDSGREAGIESPGTERTGRGIVRIRFRRQLETFYSSLSSNYFVSIQIRSSDVIPSCSRIAFIS